MRSDFSSSTLVRLLAPWAAVDVPPPTLDIGHRLGLWVSAFDAIGLQSAHQAIRAIASPLPRGRGAAGLADPASLRSDVQRTRGALAHAISQPVEGASEADAGYAPFQRRHLELQRQMDMMLRPLRDHVRQALGQASTPMRQLAALDVLLEQMLAPREASLLPQAAALLEQRFKQLRAAPDDTVDWRATFLGEWRAALLAELDLRLEPIDGLVEALCNEPQNER